MTALQLPDLWQNLVQRGRADFLVLPDNTVSYSQMGQYVRRWLAQFEALGLAPGDRIIIRSANEVAALSCWLAALCDGVVPVMQMPEAPDSKLLAIARQSGASALVTDGEQGSAPLAGDLRQITITPPASQTLWLARAW